MTAPGNTERCGLCGEQYCDAYDEDGDPVHEDCFPATVLAQVASMGRGGKRPGAGRKREIGGEATVSVTFDAASPSDTNELAALIRDGKADTQSGAIRYLIRESAKRRERRAAK